MYIFETDIVVNTILLVLILIVLYSHIITKLIIIIDIFLGLIQFYNIRIFVSLFVEYIYVNFNLHTIQFYS